MFADFFGRAVQKHVNRVDLVKSFPTSIYYLLPKIGFDTAENEPFNIWLYLQSTTHPQGHEYRSDDEWRRRARTAPARTEILKENLHPLAGHCLPHETPKPRQPFMLITKDTIE